VVGDHGVSGSGLGVARFVRFLGLGVLGVVLLLERSFWVISWMVTFLHQTRLQCSGNSADKLTKLTSTFAGTVDVRIVIYDIAFVGSEL